jgi:hypothetical protein
MNLRALAVAAILVACTTVAAAAQSENLRAQCAPASRSAVRVLCENVADATVILQPRASLALTGGNPVPGTASTLGMRLGSMPRTSLGLRVTAASVSLPPIERVDAEHNVNFPLGSINADASVGLYQGMALLPTVGGFGSVDLLGSVGIMPLPRGEGFDDSSPVSWALGARVGILRESFTAPGVSIDVMHRRIGNLAWGSPDLTEEDVYIRARRLHATSVRGVVGKRFFGFGISGGVAWDRSTSDVHATIRDAVVLDPGRVIEIHQQNLTTSRTSVFGNASLTLLILNLATEVGWQRGGAPLDSGTDRIQRPGIFGGLAVRLAI